MKKKAIKIAASTAVAASAFVAVAPAQQADAATNVTQLITDAQNAGTILKWAISAEGSADYKTRPYTEYNAAKKSIAAAEKAIAKLASSEKLSATAKLIEPKTQLDRAQAYIDALTSGEKILAKQATLQSAINNDDLKAVNDAYHILTSEIRKQAKLLYNVYGQTTRDGILANFKADAEKLYRSVSNDVTVYMHLDKASKLSTTDVVKASEELAKAYALLNDKEITFKWKAALDKNYTDVSTALPLQVVSVSNTDKNTVVVNFSKEYGSVLAAGQFTVSGETVQSAKLSTDKKAVTLTTSELNSDTEYTVSWKGVKVGTFKTAYEADKSGITFDETAAARLEATENRTFTSTLVNTDDTPYVGPVVVTLVDADGKTLASTHGAVITAVNGTKTTGKSRPANTDKNGKLVLTISAADNPTVDTKSATGVYVKVTKDVNNNGTVETTELSRTTVATHFYQLAPNNQNVSIAVSSNFIDKTADYIYDSKGSSLKYKWDSNDKFFIRGVLVSQEAFETALSNGDTLTVDYKSKVENVSSWNISNDVTIAEEVKITNPAKSTVTYDGVNYRVQGTGDAGFVVSIYRGGTYIDQTVVDASGNWSVVVPNLVQNASNVFTAYQHRNGDAISAAHGSTSVTINEGAFAATKISVKDDHNDGLTKFDQFTFDFKNPQFNHEFENGGTIVVGDRFNKKATVHVKVVNKNTLEVTDITNIDTNFNHKSASYSIESVSGVSNQDLLVLDVKESAATVIDYTNAGGGSVIVDTATVNTVAELQTAIANKVPNIVLNANVFADANISFNYPVNINVNGHAVKSVTVSHNTTGASTLTGTGLVSTLTVATPSADFTNNGNVTTADVKDVKVGTFVNGGSIGTLNFTDVSGSIKTNVGSTIGNLVLTTAPTALENNGTITTLTNKSDNANLVVTGTGTVGSATGITPQITTKSVTSGDSVIFSYEVANLTSGDSAALYSTTGDSVTLTVGQSVPTELGKPLAGTSVVTVAGTKYYVVVTRAGKVVTSATKLF